jgi:hypothetical protein
MIVINVSDLKDPVESGVHVCDIFGKDVVRVCIGRAKRE